MAKDFLDNELNEGDKVVCIQHYVSSSMFNTAYIRKLSPKTAVLNTYGTDEKYRSSDFRKSYDKIVKVNNEMFLLKVKHRWGDEAEPVGLFSSERSMEQGKADYLRKHSESGLDPDDYEFTYTMFIVDKLY